VSNHHHETLFAFKRLRLTGRVTHFGMFVRVNFCLFHHIRSLVFKRLRFGGRIAYLRVFVYVDLDMSGMISAFVIKATPGFIICQDRRGQN